MRPEPCWTSYPFQAALSWGLTALIVGLVVLAAECSLQPAHAEGPYLTVGGGFTAFMPTTADGDFVQKGLNHEYKSLAPAFYVGAGWGFSDKLAIELRYVNLGNNGYRSQFVSDLSYDSKNHRCSVPCPPTGSLVARDYVQGFDVTVLRTFTDYAYRPFVRLGAALMLHRLDVNIANNPVNVAPDSQRFIRMDGRMPMLVLGVGVKRDRFSLETTLYHGFGGSNCVSPCGFPQSTQFIVTMFGITFG